MFPQSGFAIVPRALWSAIGDQAVPVAMRRRLSLPTGVHLRDLDASVWRQYPRSVISELTEVVVAAVREAPLLDLGQRVNAISRRLAHADVPLSTRARNALILSGLADSRHIFPASLARLVQARNIGAVTLLEILSAIEYAETVAASPKHGSRSLASKAVRRAVRPFFTRRWAGKVHEDDPRLGPDLVALSPAATTAREAGELLQTAKFPVTDNVRRLTRRIRDFVATADELARLPLEGELRSLADTVMHSGVGRDVVMARFGFTGSSPATLEDAGNVRGLTRERARQLASRFQRDIEGRSSIWMPALDRAIRFVETQTPGLGSTAEREMRSHGLTQGDFAIASLVRIAELFGRRVPFVYDSTSRTLRHEGDASQSEILSAARKLITHWGASTVDSVVSAVEDEGVHVKPAFVRAMLEEVIGFHWLDSHHDWFWIRDLPRNRLLSQIEKIMAVAGSIEVADLRNGVGRHHRMHGFRPPRDVLAALCEDTGRFKREGSRILSKGDLADWRVLLADNERTLVELLFDEGLVMRKDELIARAIERGLNRNSVSVYLSYSPVLERYAPGVWGLRGAPVTAAKIKALIPPKVRHQVLQDQGWTSDGLLWVGYRLSPASIESGVLGTPGIFRKVVNGPFPLIAEDDSAVGTLVIEESMWGLSPFFRRWGAEAGDFLVIALNLTSRSARVALGDESLLLRYQLAD